MNDRIILGIILCVAGFMQMVVSEGSTASVWRFVVAVVLGGVLIFFGRRALNPYVILARQASGKTSFSDRLKRRFAPKCANCGTILDTERYARGGLVPSTLGSSAYKCRACGTRYCLDCAQKTPCKSCGGRVFDVALQ